MRQFMLSCLMTVNGSLFFESILVGNSAPRGSTKDEGRREIAVTQNPTYITCCANKCILELLENLRNI